MKKAKNTLKGTHFVSKDHFLAIWDQVKLRELNRHSNCINKLQLTTN